MPLNIPDTDRKRIVVVGGGFGGLTLAQKLAKKNFQVVLFDKQNFHQFQPLFYQVAMAGLEPSSICFPFRKIFQNKKNVIIRVSAVNGVDTTKQEVITELGNLKYDYLVLAVGADTNFFGNKEIEEKALPMKSVSEALYLRNSILFDYEKAITTTEFQSRQGLIDIVIVGGGPTGVEIAGALAEMKKYILPKEYQELDVNEIDIYLIQSPDILLKGMSAESSQKAEEFLIELGVHVMKNSRVVAYDGQFVALKDGRKIRADKVIWAAGICANQIDGLPDSVYARGNRMKINQHCQLVGFDNIYVAGDAAYLENEEYPYGHPQVAQVAIQMAKTLAKNIINQEKQKPLVNFKYKNLGAMATIGRNRAVVDLPRFKSQGFFAWTIWLFVHLFALIGAKNKLFVFINWVWNYFTYDQSLRLIIKPKVKEKQMKEPG